MRTGLLVAGMALGAYLAGAAPGWIVGGASGASGVKIAGPRTPTPPSAAAAGPASYAAAVGSAQPCVVTIIPEIRIGTGQLPPALAERMDEPPTPGTVCKGIGSGVIIRADGHVLTNNHVVEFADALGVVIPGFPETLHARVVGTDPETDLAVVKVDVDRELPAIGRGDSDRVRIGDVVLALGNPFGIGPTVSMGIVSATGRGMGSSDLEDYVQTDASINLGCSGGALVDVDGRLVGINTAIFSPRGTNIGIGFAISSNLATAIADRLIEHGRVDRGRLGMTVRQLSPAETAALSADDARGSRVERVDEHAAAQAAGVRTGDVVVAVDGIEIRSPQHLQLLVARHHPGERIDLTVARDGRTLRLKAALGDRAAQADADAAAAKDPAAAIGEHPERMRAVKTSFPL